MTNQAGSVVVRTYRNARDLSLWQEQFFGNPSAFSRQNRTFEILFINDGSPDDTWHTIQRINSSNPEVPVQWSQRGDIVDRGDVVPD